MRRNRPDLELRARLRQSAAETGIACVQCGSQLDVRNRHYATSRWNEKVRLCPGCGEVEALADHDIFQTAQYVIQRRA